MSLAGVCRLLWSAELTCNRDGLTRGTGPQEFDNYSLDEKTKRHSHWPLALSLAQIRVECMSNPIERRGQEPQKPGILHLCQPSNSALTHSSPSVHSSMLWYFNST